ncbi:fatty acid-binding protein 1, liver-like [Engystomops pustulosus]
MAFNGTYELQSQENFEPFMKSFGIPDDVIEEVKDIKRVTKIEQNGDHFVISVTTGDSVLRNEFTIGQESEMNSVTGQKNKTTVNLVDGKLVVDMNGIDSVTEISGDLLINVMTLNDIIYKSVSKRVA